MADKLYAIVPESDTVIVLRGPFSPFAPWEDANDEATPTGSRRSSVTLDACLTPDSSVNDFLWTDSRDDTLQDISEKDKGSTPSGVENTKHDFQNEPPSMEALSISTEPFTNVPTGGIHYQVSAAHLKMASKHLSKVLTRVETLSGRKDDGHVYITLHSWDETALLTLLNIVHLKNHTVTREPSLELLTQIAVLVDYYGCVEAVDSYIGVWVASARKSSPVPTKYCRELIMWLCISAVFKVEDVFKATSHVAIHQCNDGTMRTLGLPIPLEVIAAINTKRKQKIADRLTDLQIVIDRLSGDKIITCDFQCDALLLGSIIKEMNAAKLLPQPLVPYEGFSLDGVRDSVRRFQSLSFHSPQSRADAACNEVKIKKGLLNNHKSQYHVDCKTFLVYQEP